jgi:acyl-homoserine-lactone acylase
MGAEESNFESDVFYRAVLTEDRLQRFSRSQPDDSTSYSKGYVAGYNRYLKDHVGRLPESCNGADWIRPITEEDVNRLLVGIAMQFGLSQFKSDMVRAGPPGTTLAAGSTDFESQKGLGSNGIAFGGAVTNSGRGILLGNPHYPWHGSSRFHLVHMTIPEVIDVMGVSLYTTNAVAIGFNKDIAWTHTVSTALRFTLYELTLNPDNPLEYRYGDQFRPIEPRTVTVNMRRPDGKVDSKEHTVYFSHHGPIMVSDELPWTDSTAYAIRDAVIDNTASAATYAALGIAKSVDDVEAAISNQGVFWANTIAADRHGTAFYADISSTPNVDADLLDVCRIQRESIPSFVVVLDGARSACEWISDHRSHVAGTAPAEEMPRVRRRDYVSNSNDSHWLTNPDSPLEGYSPAVGPERTARSLRTRAGLVFIRELLASGLRVTPEDVRDLMYNHRIYGAELLLDEVLKVCADGTQVEVTEDKRVDIESSCEILHEWDRTANVNSAGVHLWIEFWQMAKGIENLYAVPFDPEDPVNTPRGIALGDPAVRDSLRRALALGQVRLQEAGIALDAKWGDIQYAQRNRNKIAIPGGRWGSFSIIVSELSGEGGYTPILSGNSYIQVISWDEDGRLSPSGILTYSQSQEPESAHFADLTELYSRGEWVDFPFTEDEINADPNLTVLTLTESIH